MKQREPRIFEESMIHLMPKVKNLATPLAPKGISNLGNTCYM
jgi:ubiquitin C-terminal hydrolase